MAKTSKCRGCGAEILWVKTGKKPDGKPALMPVDPPKQRMVVVEERPDGKLEGKVVVVHRSHWGTCPKADDFRRPRGSGT